MSGTRLEGRSAVITGGGRGIGRAIAEAFAREGARVVVAARTEAQIEAVAEGIRRTGGEAHPVPVDVTSDDSVTALVSQARDLLGPVEVLVHAAGVYRPNRFLDYTMGDWEEIVGVNLLGTVRVVRAFVPDMVARGWGRVIPIASTAGKYGSVLQSAYNASKHGVVGLTRCLGLELASTGVTVNAICPGFVRTEMIDEALPRMAELIGADDVAQVEAALVSRVPLGRLLEPDEVAHLAVYLASPESEAMTGQSLTISGGLIVA